MHEFWEKVEHYNAKLIPAAIIALLGIIIFELFLHVENHAVELFVLILDYFVIIVFVIDLIFLAVHSRNIKFFFKNYWLDMIAVFPFIFFFTIAGKVWKTIVAAERFVLGQSILHESLEIEKSVSALAKGGRFSKFLKMGARAVRVVTKSRLFTEFKAKHHLARRKSNKGKKKYARKKYARKKYARKK